MFLIHVLTELVRKYYYVTLENLIIFFAELNFLSCFLTDNKSEP